MMKLAASTAEKPAAVMLAVKLIFARETPSEAMQRKIIIFPLVVGENGSIFISQFYFLSIRQS